MKCQSFILTWINSLSTKITISYNLTSYTQASVFKKCLHMTDTPQQYQSMLNLLIPWEVGTVALWYRQSTSE